MAAPVSSQRGASDCTDRDTSATAYRGSNDCTPTAVCATASSSGIVKASRNRNTDVTTRRSVDNVSNRFFFRL